MKVPFVDLKAQYTAIKKEIDEAIASVIRDTAFIGGSYVAAFEKAFAETCGTSFAMGVSNGTDALRLALLACGVKPGDEVITVPNTFIATTEAISMVDAKIRFVDVNPTTFTMDPKQLESQLTPKTRAIIPVHLYGHPADMDPILDIAKKNKIRVISDAAQAHQALYKGRKIGTLGDAVCFSFFPGKNLGAYGDAGGVVTNDSDIAHSIRLLRDHGRTEKYEHEREGFNCRLDGLQAAILSAKLPYMEEWKEKRRAHAALYTELLSKIPGIQTPREDKNVSSVYHLYVIRVANRLKLKEGLTKEGIATGIHYPTPLHLQPAYSHLGLPKGSFPVTEKLSQDILSLPIYPELTNQQIEFVVQKIQSSTH